MPRPIYFTDVVGERARQESREKYYQEALEVQQKRGEAEEKGEVFEQTAPPRPREIEPQPINDTSPLWLKCKQVYR